MPGRRPVVWGRASRRSRALPVLLAALGLAIGAAAEGRTLTDSAGREVRVPEQIQRVYPAGGPASIALYTLAPDRLVAWNRSPTEADEAYMPPAYRGLPAYGRLSGRGDTANLERIMALAPDLILDFGAVREPYLSLADRLQAQTGIPTVLVDGRFEAMADSYRWLGELLGVPARAERLAAYTEETLARAARLREQVPAGQRPRVYYARDADGLTTAFQGSLAAESLTLAGARNVAGGEGRSGLASISLEQVLAWDPEVIVTSSAPFYDHVRRAPVWQQVRAVRDGRVHLAPEHPFGWFDRPPSVNRLLGLRWLAHLLYPERMETDLRDEVRRFYRLFYHLELTPDALARLLEPAAGR